MTEVKKHNVAKIEEQNTHFKKSVPQFWVKDIVVTDDNGEVLVLKLFSIARINITILSDLIEDK
jgi:hypothetical protein